MKLDGDAVCGRNHYRNIGKVGSSTMQTYQVLETPNSLGVTFSLKGVNFDWMNWTTGTNQTNQGDSLMISANHLQYIAYEFFIGNTDFPNQQPRQFYTMTFGLPVNLDWILFLGSFLIKKNIHLP